MTDTPALTNTSDMKFVHDAFRRALDDAPEQIASLEGADAAKVQNFASYLGEVLWLLHAHHGGEDELLYPLLVERAPESKDVYSRMESQHSAVASKIAAAELAAESFGRSGSKEDGEALASACVSLRDEVASHLIEEEEVVVPIASRTLTPEEWGALPAHVLSLYSGPRLWLPLGIATEMFPDDLRAQVFAHVPPPVAEMWFGFGQEAFTAEMATIRGTGS